MSVPKRSRHVYPGESIKLIADGCPWNVYVKTAPDSYSIRLASYTSDGGLIVPDGLAAGLQPAANAIGQTDGDPELTADALELIREAGHNNRSSQVILYSAEGAAVFIYALDFGDFGATDIDEAIASDAEFLAVLEKARADATDTKGISVVKLPDGREETYRSVAALNADIAVTRDRIARYKAHRAGRRFVGGYV